MNSYKIKINLWIIFIFFLVIISACSKSEQSNLIQNNILREETTNTYELKQAEEEQSMLENRELIKIKRDREGVIIYNKGILGQFNRGDHRNSKLNQMIDDRVKQDYEIGYNDTYSIRAKATKSMPDDFFRGDGFKNRHHSEVHTGPIAGEGDIRIASFAVKFEGVNNSNRILNQWMDVRTWTPASFLAMNPVSGGNELQIKLVVILPGKKRIDLAHFDQVSRALVGDDSWWTFTTVHKFSIESEGPHAGYIDVYINGQKVPPDPRYGGNGHTYQGATLPFTHDGNFLQYQIGNYVYFQEHAKPEDESINYIDEIIVTDQRIPIEDVLNMYRLN